MKRGMIVESTVETDGVLIEILKCNLTPMIDQKKSFIVWHSTCRDMRNTLGEDLFLGDYYIQFCRETIEKHRHKLRISKNSFHLHRITELQFMVKLRDAIDAIMGPIVFDEEVMRNKYVESCTLEALGLPQQPKISDYDQLWKLLKEASQKIKEKYAWRLQLLRDGTIYNFDGLSIRYAKNTDYCVLLPIVVPQKTPSISTKSVLLNTEKESGVIRMFNREDYDRVLGIYRRQVNTGCTLF